MIKIKNLENYINEQKNEHDKVTINIQEYYKKVCQELVEKNDKEQNLLVREANNQSAVKYNELKE